MTDKFARAFDPPDPATLLPSPVQSIQSSLYQRLRRSYGRQAGTVGWLLVRLAQPKHRDHASAVASVSALPRGPLGALAACARATLDAATRPDARELAAGIVTALGAVAELADGGDPVEAATLADYLTGMRMAAAERKKAGTP
jgi:hypothetical protein